MCDYPRCTETETVPVMDYSSSPPVWVELCDGHAGPQASTPDYYL